MMVAGGGGGWGVGGIYGTALAYGEADIKFCLWTMGGGGGTGKTRERHLVPGSAESSTFMLIRTPVVGIG